MLKNNMFAFEFEDKNKKNRDVSIPPSAEIAEETDRITTREIDEYIRKGKNFDDNEKKKKATK